MKILILEDDKWFADSLRAVLEPSFAVRVCHDPEEVFKVVEKWRPDVLLADVILGAKNLFVLLHEMQSYIDTRGVPIVILSSAAGQIDPRDVENFNVKKVLDKAEVTPVNLRESLREIKNTRHFEVQVEESLRPGGET